MKRKAKDHQQGEDLFARIAQDPDDDGAYLVYADWLTTTGDPQGELIVLMHQQASASSDAQRAHLGSAIDAYFTKHRAKLFGKLWKNQGIAWDFHLGFLREVRVFPMGAPCLPAVNELLALPIVKLLRELYVYTGEREHAAITEAVEHARPRALSALTLVPEHTSVDAATAAGAEARWLRIHENIGVVPPAVYELTNLEWLDINSISLTEIPPDIGELQRLRRLDVDGSYDLKVLPEELFGIATLQHLSMSDCFDLRDTYHAGRMNNLLAGFARARTPSRRRVVELSLMLGRTDRIAKLATTADLLAALDSNIADVRTGALASLATALPDPFAQATDVGDASFAILGTTNYDRKLITAKLGERGAAVTAKVDDATTHVVLGESPGGKHTDLGDRAIVLEVHLKGLFAAKPKAKGKAKGKGKQAGALDVEAIRAQLRSRDDKQTAKAVAALKDAMVPDELLLDLLVVVQDVALGKSRDAAKKVFAIAAPPAVAAAVKQHLKSSLLLEGLGETKRAERIAAFCRDAKVIDVDPSRRRGARSEAERSIDVDPSRRRGARSEAERSIDGLELAQLLVARASVGLGYVFQHGKPADITRALEAVMARSEDRTTLHLWTKELSAAPAELAGIAKCKSLTLANNHLTAFPGAVLAMKSLARLDISGNRIWTIPESIGAMRLEALDVGGNRMRRFPMPVLAITTLRELDVSNRQEYVPTESRITGLPDEIRNLKHLRELRFQFNILPALPDGLYALKELEVLSLLQCDLPAEIPPRLAELKKLRELDVRYSTWADRTKELKKLLPKVKFPS